MDPSTPKNSAPTSPEPKSGFIEFFKKSINNFKMLGTDEKIITIGLSILAALPTFLIGGVFAFAACSEYFASKKFEKLSGNEDTFLANTAAAAQPILFPKKENTKTNLDVIGSSLLDLDDAIDRIDPESKNATGALIQCREALGRFKSDLQMLKSNGVDIDSVLFLVKSVEAKIETQQEKHDQRSLDKSELFASTLTESENIGDNLAFLESKIDALRFDDGAEVLLAGRLLDEITESRTIYKEILEESGPDFTHKSDFTKIIQQYDNLEKALREKIKANAEIFYSYVVSGLDIQTGNDSDKRVLESQKILNDFKVELKDCAQSQEIFEKIVSKSQGKVEAIIPKGIKNIGNSCYINSTMQALIGNNAIKEKLMNPVWPGVSAIIDRVPQVAVDKNYFDLFDGGLIGQHFAALDAGIKPEEVSKNHPGMLQIYKDYCIAKQIQIQTQKFIVQLDHSKEPKDMLESARSLRAALFASGIFDQNIWDQQDAALLTGLLLQNCGFSVPYETLRQVPNSDIRKQSIERTGCVQVPIHVGKKNESLYLQDQIDRLFTTTPIDDERNALNVDGKLYPQYQETISLGKEPPQQILLQMKRFGNDLKKIQNPLNIPKNQIIDCTKAFREAGEKVEYRITGAIHHNGNVGGGHYRGYTLKGDKWYEADDSTITAKQQIDSILSTAYILVLEKV